VAGLVGAGETRCHAPNPGRSPTPSLAWQFASTPPFPLQDAQTDARSGSPAW